MLMSKLQKISRTRNWLKGRLAGIKNNLAAVDEKVLHPDERQQLKEAHSLLDRMLLSWDERYDQIKEDLKDESS